MTLHNQGLGLVAYYYFDFRDTAKQDIHGLLSSLVIQLCAKSDLCYDILSDLYSKHDVGLHLPNDEVLTQCLKEMLGLPGQPPIYIVIDALNECPDTSGAPSVAQAATDILEVSKKAIETEVTSEVEETLLVTQHTYGDRGSILQ